jgi:hypothetical protein
MKFTAIVAGALIISGLPSSGRAAEQSAAGPLTPQGQESPVIFKSGIEFVTFTVRVVHKGADKKPRLGLAISDFILKIDGKVRPIARLETLDDGKPTHAYLLLYAPTPADRDGRKHKMEVQVKGIGKVVTRTFTIER